MQPVRRDEEELSSWVAVCAYRLRQRWPRLPIETLEDTARELLVDTKLQGMEPVEAAEKWLRRAAEIG